MNEHDKHYGHDDRTYVQPTDKQKERPKTDRESRTHTKKRETIKTTDMT